MQLLKTRRSRYGIEAVISFQGAESYEIATDWRHGKAKLSKNPFRAFHVVGGGYNDDAFPTPFLG